MIARPFYFAGILGRQPSRYSKSPGLWNAAFKEIGVKAIYVPFDVPEARVKLLLQKLRRCPRLLGLNVTVPYKTKAAQLIDTLDPEARSVGAVNTIVRNKRGRLIGFNTDGIGAIQSLVGVLPGQKRPFVGSLSGLTVILLGAGGAARSLAFSLAKSLGSKGRLFICNRTHKKAVELSRAIRKIFRHCESARHLKNLSGQADLIINATSKDRPETISPWMGGLEKSTRLFDLAYSSPESVFLKMGRSRGCPTLNGKAMLIHQAAEAFAKIMEHHASWKNYLRKHPAGKERILKVMADAWARSH